MSNDPTNATLTERRDLNEMAAIVRVRPDSGTVPPFVPGQFITLGLPRPLAPEVAEMMKKKPGRVPMIKRAYSIGSDPRVTESYELFVVLVEEGKLTPTLWTLDHGGRVWMDEVAKGEFTLDPVPPGKNLVMISTGTGIAPFMSMLRHFHGRGRWQHFVMINGVRRASDLGYRDELEQLAREDSTFKYVPVVSREPDWSGLKGRVQAALEPDAYARLVGVPLHPEDCHVFLCGNPTMIDELEVTLQGRGFITHTREKSGTIHFERYW